MSQPYPAHSKNAERLVGILCLLFVSPITLGLVIAMNKSVPEPVEYKAGPQIEFEVRKPKPQKKKEPKKVERKKPPKSSAKPLAPPPNLNVGFDGIDFGLEEFSFGGVATITDEMIGDMDGLVMTKDSVDNQPILKYSPPLNFPPRAKAQNIEGVVELYFTVGSDGGTKNIRVRESNPPEVFDEAAMNWARAARFSPAKYKGRPVDMNVTQTLNFSLN